MLVNSYFARLLASGARLVRKLYFSRAVSTFIDLSTSQQWTEKQRSKKKSSEFFHWCNVEWIANTARITTRTRRKAQVLVEIYSLHTAIGRVPLPIGLKMRNSQPRPMKGELG